MALKEEIEARRANIHTDGYPMSIGEIISMYRDGEIDIHPEFQRFFRWSPVQKSKLIESILLGIPIPSIFVSQRKDGVWDVVDGLQRLSTIFETIGELRSEKGDTVPKLVLSATKYLPSLENKVWSDDESDPNSLGRDLQLIVKRAKIDIKIVLRESDDSSKYELFQRLNTGGSVLSDQELRNCVVIMVNRDFFKWMKTLGDDDSFRKCIALTDRQTDEQYHLELLTRFLVFRRFPADEMTRALKDLGTFLNDRIMEIALSASFDKSNEEAAFRFTFGHLASALGANAFHRFDSAKGKFVGSFLISAFEVLAMGLGYNFEAYTGAPDRLEQKAKRLWKNNEFLDGIGSGVTASSRMPVTIPLGRKLLKP